MTDYVVASIRPWNVAAFERHTPSLPGRWHLITRREQLTEQRLAEIAPRYVFFPHWSWPVRAAIVDRFECVCFHMTDVPFGRGGSPLQNLIASGHHETKLTALRMVEEMDAGPVYLKLPLSLAGSAQEIFERAADLAYTAIRQIVADERTPQPQRGEPTFFRRRRPTESLLPAAPDSIERVFDHIRMLDAETYPLAFLDHGTLRLEFRDAQRVGDVVTATVAIRFRADDKAST